MTNSYVMVAAASAVAFLSQTTPVLGFAGEEGAFGVEGKPYHHEEMTMRALAGDAAVYGELASRVMFPGIGFSLSAAASIAWHADEINTRATRCTRRQLLL